MTPSALPAPPGPGRALKLAELRGRPLDFLVELKAAYGDVFGYVVDGEQVVVVSSPRDISTVLRSQADRYPKVDTPDQFVLRPLMGNGLFTSSGAQWRRQRPVLAPMFRPAQVSRFDGVITSAAEELAQKWATDDSTAVAVDAPLSALTLQILVEAVFGKALTVGAGFASAVDDINHFLGRFRGQDVADNPDAARSLARYTRGSAVVRGITGALVDSMGHTDGSSGAVLQRLAGLVETRQELCDQVMTLLMAGHETTAKTLGWALHLMSLHPEQQELVAQEAAEVAAGRPLTAADLPRLVHATAAVREAMRLYPPVWLFSRRAVAEGELGGCLVPAGALVCISPWLVHRDARWWPQPEQFRLDRALDDVAAGPFTYLPFGGGERVCIGQHLALLEATLVLSTLLARCVVAPGGAAVEPEALVTLRPRGGLGLAVRSRWAARRAVVGAGAA
ncbi:MAG TPA: cytochrome P450 [Mycobacteriales bacterium]|nr:cytochrome P450 [Mycobacteriales bacterium]